MLDAVSLKRFRDTLFAGKYNLLLGSGISLYSRDRHGLLLRGTDKLRQDICAVTGASPTTSLPRSYALLTQQQRADELVDKYSRCQPGNELLPLRQCLWKRAFTFNIDDVVENLYAHRKGAQELATLNFDSAFEPDTDVSELQCVHLHGYAGRPDSGFVFSHNEYARLLHGNNPWMLLLCETLPVEAFIIAGTSFNEVDLEYYLARRTPSTPRRSRGPSLLIEPNPDAATRADCARYDLTLVEAGWLTGPVASCRTRLCWLARTRVGWRMRAEGASETPPTSGRGDVARDPSRETLPATSPARGDNRILVVGCWLTGMAILVSRGRFWCGFRPRFGGCAGDSSRDSRP